MGFLGVEMICGMVSIIVLLASASWAMRILEWFWLKPRRVEKALRAQGLQGTPYRFPSGDLKDNARLQKEAKTKPIPIHASPHSIIPRVSPLIFHSINKYDWRSELP